MQWCRVFLVFGRIPFAVKIADHAISECDAALGIKNFDNCALLCYYAASKKGPIGCPEALVRNYHVSLRNNPEERSFHLLRGGSLKSRNEERCFHKSY